VPYIALFFQVP